MLTTKNYKTWFFVQNSVFLWCNLWNKIPKTTNISVTSWVILLVFLPPVYYPWKLQIDHVIVWAYSEITNDRHLKKECSYSAEDFVCTLVFMATVNYSIFFSCYKVLQCLFFFYLCYPYTEQSKIDELRDSIFICSI